MTRAALFLSPKAGYLLVLALVLLAAAWSVPIPLVGLVLLVVGMTFLSMAFLVRLLFLRHEHGRQDLSQSIETIVEYDAAVCVTTDADGRVTYRNRAAIDRFSEGRDSTDETLSAMISDLFASPGAVLNRLQNKAQIAGSAQEDVVLRRGHMRLSVHQVGPDGFLWRLEEIGDKGPSGRTGENINLPMMTVSKTGTILFMNEALRRLLGGRQTSLDRVFTDLPLKNGFVTQVSAQSGPVNALICEIASSAGRREIYLLPEPEDRGAHSQDWNIEDTLPVPILKIDSQGVITMANTLACALLGDDAAVGTLFSDQVEGAGRPVSDWLREVMAGRLLDRSEVVRALKPEGEVFLQVTMSLVNDESGRNLVAVLQDATKLKTIEAQYLQAQKMQAIGQLAGGVAHDFNNLLTAISGHCDLLLLRHDESDQDYADLSQIRQNANRAAALVGQLLAFSRKQTLRPEIVDLTDTMGDLTHLLNRLVGEKVQLDLSHDNALLPIRADKRHLEQVIMNLVVNGRDAMPDGGVIRLETRNLILSTPLERDRATVPAGEYVTIRVRDQGCGIPQDKIGKIFEPFYTTKGAGKGTGLGLSMAYGIIKQTGGYIFVDSVVGTGTTFTLYFPVAVEEEPATVKESAQTVRDQTVVPLSQEMQADDQNPPNPGADDQQHPPQTGAEADSSLLASIASSVQDSPEAVKPLPQPTHPPSPAEGGIVLLVEDEAPVRAFASRALRMRGFTVLEAENAEEALKTLEDESLNVDIFVTDVIMPGMDGPTWVSQALKTRPGVKVVFVSGYAEDSVAEQQARIPNSVFLPKPFSLSELTSTVQNQLH
ncbi:MAG TPA: response regulator [Aliiroseovarius sp.]|nr:response regulator [Aliiroseovarius sp.]